MKTLKNNWLMLFGICASGVIILAATLQTIAQTGPVLTITPLGTNQFSIAITNDSATETYDLQWAPTPASPNYQWSWATPGASGQTNYIVNGLYDSGFYRVILDTNNPPLWEAANPANPSLGALTVTIDSPTNGAVLQ